MNDILSAWWLPYVLGSVTAGLWVVLLVLFLKTRRT